MSGLLFFHRDGDGTVRRQANLLTFNISYQAQVDEMMVSFVPAFTAVIVYESWGAFVDNNQPGRVALAGSATGTPFDVGCISLL